MWSSLLCLGVVVVFVGNAGTHPYIAGVDDFPSRVVNDVVGYLVNGDVPSRVLRDGINRRVSNTVSKIMGVVHVEGHRCPQQLGPYSQGQPTHSSRK